LERGLKLKKTKKTKWPSTPHERLAAKIIKLNKELARLNKEYKEGEVDE